MGKGIKTRVSAKKGIKAIDKAAVASERMKEAYIRTKDKADHSLYAEESSPGEYFITNRDFCNLTETFTIKSETKDYPGNAWIGVVKPRKGSYP